ncbi:hypothetical protein [Actinomadura sp. DC4]|uniref:hypothetical protein n=1 Tax=Actinomadura sp. DC4 TaxID=3055069 RepID=UPI0025B00962|nr:hypothetical protein [Actinomadura sp. DC4]MDN3351751.1 hypothetical protein [Actinomadura sp. DC4]
MQGLHALIEHPVHLGVAHPPQLTQQVRDRRARRHLDTRHRDITHVHHHYCT